MTTQEIESLARTLIQTCVGPQHICAYRSGTNLYGTHRLWLQSLMEPDKPMPVSRERQMDAFEEAFVAFYGRLTESHWAMLVSRAP